MTTIQQAIEQFLSVKKGSPRTITAYRNGLTAFCEALAQGRPKKKPAAQDEDRDEIGKSENWERLDPHSADIRALDESWMSAFIASLKDKSPATESLYVTAATVFYRYLVAERLANPYLPALEQIVAERTRKIGRRRPKFPRDEIERLIAYAESLAAKSVDGAAAAEFKTEAARKAARERARLRNLRDRAFILLLADTGLRVSEACALKIEDIDFLEGRLSVLGKGDNEDLVRVSERALAALRDYLEAQDLPARRRALAQTKQQSPFSLRQEQGQKRSERRRLVQEKSLYVFVRHDRGAKAGAGRIAASTAWEFVRSRAVEAVGAEPAAQIHPHSFRHYFVTVVLLATNNIEKARRMARHRNIATTQLYAEIDPELDQDYHEIFNKR